MKVKIDSLPFRISWSQLRNKLSNSKRSTRKLAFLAISVLRVDTYIWRKCGIVVRLPVLANSPTFMTVPYKCPFCHFPRLWQRNTILTIMHTHSSTAIRHLLFSYLCLISVYSLHTSLYFPKIGMNWLNLLNGIIFSDTELKRGVCCLMSSALTFATLIKTLEARQWKPGLTLVQRKKYSGSKIQIKESTDYLYI